MPQGAIYITETEDKQLYLYYDREGHPHPPLYKGSEAHPPFHLKYPQEGKYDVDFIVHVPSFLRTEEAEIRRFIDLYKPASKTYRIEFYDYE